MSLLTPNWDLPYPDPSAAADVPGDIHALALKLDDRPPFTYGVAASRPVSTGGSPGKVNRFYFSTDTSVLERDTGTSWVPVVPTDATLAALAAITTVANKLIYATGVDTFATADLTAAGRALLDDADAAAQRATLGLGSAALLASSALPGSEIGYDPFTAPVNVTSTTESAGTTVITAAAHTFDGAPVIAEFFSPRVSVDHISMVISLFEGATQIGRLASVESDAADTADIGRPVLARLRFTPSAGAHTYKVTAFRSAAQDALVVGAAGGTSTHVPGYLRFTKV